MTERDGDPTAEQDTGTSLASDRRRPGRREEVDPLLVPLLRGEFDEALPPEPAEADPESVAAIDPHRELMIGLVMAAALLLAGVALRFAV